MVAASTNPIRILVYLTGNVLFSIGLFFHAFIYNFYLGEIGFGALEMGYAAAALTAGGLAALVPAGKLVDRFGGRPVILAASVLAGLGLTGSAFAESIPVIVGTSVVAGAATASWRVAMAPLVMWLTVPANRARIFSWNVALLVGGGGLWIAAAGHLPEQVSSWTGQGALWGYRFTMVAGALGTILAFVAYSLLGGGQERDARAVRSPEVSGAEPVLDARLAVAVGVVAFWMLAPALVAPFFNIFFVRSHGVEVASVGWIFALSHFATAAIIFGGGELANRLGTYRMLAVWTLAYAPMMIALASVDVMWGAVALYLLQGIISPATNPLIDQILMERSAEERRGVISSWRNAATELSGVVGAGLGGWLIQQFDFRGLFLSAGLVGGIGALLLLVTLRSRLFRAASPAVEQPVEQLVGTHR